MILVIDIYVVQKRLWECKWQWLNKLWISEWIDPHNF